MQQLLELVIIFKDNSMVLQLNSGSEETILNLINDSVRKVWETKEVVFINFDAASGKSMVIANLILGYYVRPSSESANEDFKKKIIELTERQVNAAEKQIGENEGWKQ